MNVLFFIPSLVGGGAEKLLVGMMKELDPDKYNITLRTINDIGIYRNALPSYVKYKPINRFRNHFLFRCYQFIINYLIPSRIAYWLYLKGDYDTEVAFLEGTCTRILSASSNKESRKYAWVHTDFTNFHDVDRFYVGESALKNSYKRFDKIVFVSETAQAGFEHRFGNIFQAVVIHPGIDVDLIQQKAVEFVDSRMLIYCPLCVSVGRINKQKGYDRLLSAHKQLISKGYHYILWIIGEGPEKDALEQYVQNNHLSDSVKLLGYQTNPYQYMKQADFYVCSSRVEGYSLVIMEALCLGLPILATDCSGMQDILHSGEYGLIVENSTEGILDGMEQLLSNIDLRMGYTNKVKTGGFDFSIKRMASTVDHLFNE